MALTEKLTNIADAIREKTGGTEKLSLDGMAEAIAGISAGGGDEQSVLDSLIDRSITEVRSNATSVGECSFANCKSLTSANFPLATSIGTRAFEFCEKLSSVDFPIATSIGVYAFSYCSVLSSVELPLATSISNYAFNYCSALTSANFPLATSISQGAFSGCKAITIVDYPLATSIGNYAFQDCCSLKAVVLRSDSICSLGNKNAFNNCYHFLGTVNATYNPDGLKDGYFYVPRKWLSDDDETKDYRRATNWSEFSTQFRALEDYTVDGTTTGTLDESKI